MNRWDSYRARRPNRSRLAETVIVTALVSLVVVAFGAALFAAMTNP